MPDERALPRQARSPSPSSLSSWSSSPTLLPETASADSFPDTSTYHRLPRTAAARPRVASPDSSVGTEETLAGAETEAMPHRDIIATYYCLRMFQLTIAGAMLATSFLALKRLGPQLPGVEPVSPHVVPIFFAGYLLMAVLLATTYSPTGIVFFVLQDLAWLPGLIPFGQHLRNLIWCPECIQSVDHVIDPAFYTLLKVHFLLLFPLWMSLLCSTVTGYIMWHRIANG